MRGILVDRWYLGPLLAAIALMMVSSFEGDHLRIRIEERRLASVENIYRLAFERKFDELRKSGFVDEESVEYLMEQDTLFGPIRSWNVDSDYDGARVQVIRTGLTAHDDMYCSDGASETKLHFSVGSGEYEDFSGRAVSAKSAKQAIEIARTFIHEHTPDVNTKVLGLLAQMRGSDWVVTEKYRLNGEYLRRHIVVPTMPGNVRGVTDQERYLSLSGIPDFP